MQHILAVFSCHSGPKYGNGLFCISLQGYADNIAIIIVVNLFFRKIVVDTTGSPATLRNNEIVSHIKTLSLCNVIITLLNPKNLMADTKPSVTEKMYHCLALSAMGYHFISQPQIHIFGMLMALFLYGVIREKFEEISFHLTITNFCCVESTISRNSRELSSQTSPIALISGCFANVSFYGSLLVNLLIAKARIAEIIAYFFGFPLCFPSIFGKALSNSKKPCTLIFNIELDLRWSYSNTSCALTTVGCINFITLLGLEITVKLRFTVVLLIIAMKEFN
uniref:Uncharacterized protein n=1 Tax=Wuchereria bancrofti TaxID=6293 RepID=A0A1I8ERF6_WUCBA